MTPDSAPDLAELARLFGTVSRDSRESRRPRPTGTDDATVKALGTLSEALEVVENARGYLYAFHRLSGMADLRLQDAIEELRAAGHGREADVADAVLVGRDVVDDKWTFELVEAYDQQYWSVFRQIERAIRSSVGDVPPHVFEAELKQQEQGDDAAS